MENFVMEQIVQFASILIGFLFCKNNQIHKLSHLKQ
jgi:hypothetical protein